MPANLTLSIPERLDAVEGALAAVEGDQFDSYIKLSAVEGHQYQLATRFLDALIASRADPVVLCAFGASYQDEFDPEPEEWTADSSL